MNNSKNKKETINQLQCIQKEKLAQLILDKYWQILSQKIQTKRSLTDVSDDVELDLQQELLLYSNQKYRLNDVTRDRLIKSHNNHQIKQISHKPFILLFSGAYLKKLQNPGYYDLLLANKHRYPDRFFVSIQKDINRTFAQQTDELEKLRNILSAYAIRNPNLLYCQGLNYVVAYFIKNKFSEQESFWIVASLIQQILPIDYYLELGAIITLNSLFNLLMKEVLPEFMAMCQQIHIETSFFFVQWLVCLYTKGFPEELSRYFMELIVVERQLSLIKIAICIIKLISKSLSSSSDFSKIIKQIEILSGNLKLEDFRKQYSKFYMNVEFFQILWNNFRKQYQNQSAKKNDKFKEVYSEKKKTFPLCSTQYPVCLHILQINRKFRGLNQVESLKVKQDLDDYYEVNYFNQSPKIIMTKLNSFKIENNIDQILLGRHTHICTNRSNIRSRSNAIFGDIKSKKSTKSNLNIMLIKQDNNEDNKNDDNTILEYSKSVECSKEKQFEQKIQQIINQSKTIKVLDDIPITDIQESRYIMHSQVVSNEESKPNQIQERLSQFQIKFIPTKHIYQQISEYFEIDPNFQEEQFENDPDKNILRQISESKQVEQALSSSTTLIKLPKLILSRLKNFFQKLF